jgi:hypothetical protein
MILQRASTGALSQTMVSGSAPTDRTLALASDTSPGFLDTNNFDIVYADSFASTPLSRIREDST